MRSLLVALALFTAVPANADEVADEAALATRFVQAADLPLRAAARRAVERAVSARIPDLGGAERDAMTAQVVAVLEPIVARRWPQLKTALKDAVSAEFTAAELQDLIDIQTLITRPDVASAMLAAERATTDGARLHSFATLPREDMNRVIMALGSPLARRLDATLRRVAEGLGSEVAGEAFAALGRACTPAGSAAPPRWCEAMPAP